MPALTPHIRCAQEGLVGDTEQFKVLHNLVLPVFTFSWDQLRSYAVLTEDANAGEMAVFIDRPFYGKTGSSTNGFAGYPNSLFSLRQFFGDRVMDVVSSEAWETIGNYLINTCRFAFSNGNMAHLNGEGCLNQLGRLYFGDEILVYMLETLFPEEQEFVDRYRRVFAQEQAKAPGTMIENENWVIDGYGYAMLRSENRVWDHRMETLLSSKHLLQDPGDHVSRDCLGIVVYGLGGIVKPRYGYSWVGHLPPFLNQVMIDEAWQNNENGYYGSFWHFDGREELPSAVAHTGDGDDCSQRAGPCSRRLAHQQSRMGR